MLVSFSLPRFEFTPVLTWNRWVESVKHEFTYIDPGKLKERNILFQVQAAESHGKLATGILDVWHAAKQQKGKLLVAEIGYLFPGTYKRHNKLVAVNLPENVVMSISDAVDETISEVLGGGGAIEFVENGRMRKYGRIVLVQDDVNVHESGQLSC